MHLNVEATHPKHNSFPGRFIQCNHLFSASAQKKKGKKKGQHSKINRTVWNSTAKATISPHF